MTESRDTLSDRLAPHFVKPRTKRCDGYTTDAGVEIAEHTLYACDCTCGHRGSAWYANHERALRSWRRHIPQEAS